MAMIDVVSFHRSDNVSVRYIHVDQHLTCLSNGNMVYITIILQINNKW